MGEEGAFSQGSDDSFSSGSESEDERHGSESEDSYVAPGLQGDPEGVDLLSENDSTVASPGHGSADVSTGTQSGSTYPADKKPQKICRWLCTWSRSEFQVRVPSQFNNVLTNMAKSDLCYRAVFPPSAPSLIDRPGDPLHGISVQPSKSTAPQFPMHPTLPVAFARDEKRVCKGRAGFNEAAIAAAFSSTPEDEKKYFSETLFGQEACDFLRTFSRWNPSERKVYKDKVSDEMEKQDRWIDCDLAHVVRLQNALLCLTGYLPNASLNPGDSERFSRRALEDMIEISQFLSAHSACLIMN